MANKDNTLHLVRVRARECFRTGNRIEAESLYHKLTSADEQDLEAWQMLGTIYWDSGRVEEAGDCFRKALAINPDHHEVNYQLGCVHLAYQDHEKALRCFQRAVEQGRTFYEPWVLMGNIYAWVGELTNAVTSYRQAIAINPQDPVPCSNLGNILADQGLLADAVAAWKQALELDSGHISAHSNLLLGLNYDPDRSAESIFRAHIQWSDQHTKDLDVYTTYTNRRDPDRRLRIGYVSTDLREHSVAYFMEPVLANHNKKDYEVYTYSCSGASDPTAVRLQSYATVNRNIVESTDPDVAAQIREDGIDILVDLAGHTAGNRLLVFARRPAPVQVTYVGYPNTTGMKEIDYRLTDQWSDPAGSTEKLYTEELVRLPHGFLCYRPPQEAPDVGPLPVETKGYITFGSFNNVAKITPVTLEAWARILNAVENSRLMLKSKAFTDQATCDLFRDRAKAQGIDPERITLTGLTSKLEHMAMYGAIDIALDTFPYNGTTTTCDALWMGVPVVTLAGDTHAGRVGVSLLSRVGMEEFVTSGMDSYVEVARKLAGDTRRLSELRLSQREKMETSSICDGALITNDVEIAYRKMWEDWCTYTRAATEAKRNT